MYVVCVWYIMMCCVIPHNLQLSYSVQQVCSPLVSQQVLGYRLVGHRFLPLHWLVAVSHVWPWSQQLQQTQQMQQQQQTQQQTHYCRMLHAGEGFLLHTRLTDAELSYNTVLLQATFFQSCCAAFLMQSSLVLHAAALQLAAVHCHTEAGQSHVGLGTIDDSNI